MRFKVKVRNSRPALLYAITSTFLWSWVQITLFRGRDWFTPSLAVLMVVGFLGLQAIALLLIGSLKVKIEVKPQVSIVPGTKLLALVDFLFRPTTVKLTFTPIIADWHVEYFDALNQGRTIKARWIMVRYRFYFACTFIKAMGLSKVLSFFKQVSK